MRPPTGQQPQLSRLPSIGRLTGLGRSTAPDPITSGELEAKGQSIASRPLIKKFVKVIELLNQPNHAIARDRFLNEDNGNRAVREWFLKASTHDLSQGICYGSALAWSAFDADGKGDQFNALALAIVNMQEHELLVDIAKPAAESAIKKFLLPIYVAQMEDVIEIERPGNYFDYGERSTFLPFAGSACFSGSLEVFSREVFEGELLPRGGRIILSMTSDHTDRYCHAIAIAKDHHGNIHIFDGNHPHGAQPIANTPQLTREIHAARSQRIRVPLEGSEPLHCHCSLLLGLNPGLDPKAIAVQFHAGIFGLLGATDGRGIDVNTLIDQVDLTRTRNNPEWLAYLLGACPKGTLEHSDLAWDTWIHDEIIHPSRNGDILKVLLDHIPEGKLREIQSRRLPEGSIISAENFLARATRLGHSSMVKVLAEHPLTRDGLLKPTKVHSYDEPISPLMLAIRNENLAVVKAMIASPAFDPHYQEGDQKVHAVIASTFAHDRALMTALRHRMNPLQAMLPGWLTGLV